MPSTGNAIPLTQGDLRTKADSAWRNASSAHNPPPFPTSLDTLKIPRPDVLSCFLTSGLG